MALRPPVQRAKSLRKKARERTLWSMSPYICIQERRLWSRPELATKAACTTHACGVQAIKRNKSTELLAGRRQPSLPAETERINPAEPGGLCTTRRYFYIRKADSCRKGKSDDNLWPKKKGKGAAHKDEDGGRGGGLRPEVDAQKAVLFVPPIPLSKTNAKSRVASLDSSENLRVFGKHGRCVRKSGVVHPWSLAPLLSYAVFVVRFR